MKKRLLALAIAAIMLIGLVPATVLTATAATPTYQSFSSAALANDVTVSADGYTATIKDTDSTSGTNQVYLYKVFSGMTNPHMTQTIQINSMPVFDRIAISGNVHQCSGYFNVMEGPRTGNGQDVPYVEHYIRYSIYRADDAGNLKLTIFKNNYANGGAAVTEENSYTVALNKKLGDEFTLTTLWNDHDTVSFYCGGSLLATYEDVTFERGNYAGLDALFFGYLPYLADTNYAATTEIIVKNMIIADGHTPAEDDGDCTTAIKCAECGEIATAGAASHTEKLVNAKSATATENGYTGDKVCSVCEKELAKGEVIPATGVPAESTPAESTPAESTPAESTPAESTPAESTPAESTPAESTPAESTPAESTPAESTPAESTPAESTPATSAPAATTPAASTPAATTPSNPETGSESNAMYVALLTVSMLAIAALMIPEIRNKLIRK